MASGIAFQMTLVKFFRESYGMITGKLFGRFTKDEVINEELDYMICVYEQMHEDWAKLTMPRVQAQLDAVRISIFFCFVRC